MKKVFHKILVPLDGSEEAEGVLSYLKYLAPKFNSKVDIVGIGAGNKRRRINHLLRDYIDEVSADLQTHGIESRALLLYGIPADKILDYSKENEIDLIIMATHGRGGITRWWMGSVTEKIISEASTPVLLIQSKRSKESKAMEKLSFSNILAPLDGSAIGEAALSHAEILAMETGASLTLLRVIPQPSLVETSILGSNSKKLTEAMHDAGKDYLDNIAKKLGDQGIKTVCEMITGDPANEIVDYAKNKKVSIIAMSTHGRSGIPRWVLGSVADKILHEAKVPVWIVRPPKMTRPKPQKE